MRVEIKTSSLSAWLAVLILTAGVVPSLFAQSPSRPNRLHPTTNVLFEDTVSTSFIFPVVGSAPGANGTFWRSDTVISNFKNDVQRVSITFLPQGVSGINATPVFRDLPSYLNGGELALVTEDIVASLGFSGLGTLVVQAVDASGNPDPTAKIDGISRVWTPQPGATAGTMSQLILSTPPNLLVGPQFSAFAIGAKQDDNFRTNVGVVNLSTQTQTFRVDVAGSTGAEVEFRVTVPPMSMQQTPIPAGNFGTMSIAFSLEGTNVSTVSWNAYTSSVDNVSGDSFARNAVY